MNKEDKKRFARYRPGYKEPELSAELDDDENNKEKKNEKVKDTLGFVENIKINPDDLINQVINEMEQKPKT